MVITCSVRKGTSPGMKRSLAGACPNVLVVVASTEVRYALCICGRHVVVRTLLGPAVRQTVQVCTLHVGVGKLHLVKEMRRYDSYNIANVVDSMSVAVVCCILVYTHVYFVILTSICDIMSDILW